MTSEKSRNIVFNLQNSGRKHEVTKKFSAKESKKRKNEKYFQKHDKTGVMA